ncbi:hypothetical protein [Rhodococcus sp. LW-XY12]|nr:hypothetical protein [Rhodococcus sp. LW-XY12]
MDRIDKLIDVMRPILGKRGTNLPANLSAEDLATNKFIDPAIGLQ